MAMHTDHNNRIKMALWLSKFLRVFYHVFVSESLCQRVHHWWVNSELAFLDGSSLQVTEPDADPIFVYIGAGGRL